MFRPRSHAHPKSQGIGVAPHRPLGSSMGKEWFPKIGVLFAKEEGKDVRQLKATDLYYLCVKLKSLHFTI